MANDPTDQGHGVEQWLRLAQEARDRAATIHDPYSKRTLLLIAQRYEMLAERAERTKKSEGDANQGA